MNDTETLNASVNSSQGLSEPSLNSTFKIIFYFSVVSVSNPFF